MSYSRRMLVIESVRKASIGISNILEKQKLVEAYLDDYYNLTELVFKQYMKTARYKNAKNYYIYVLEVLSSNVSQVRLEAEGYIAKILLNLGDMYRENEQYKDAHNMYLAANRNIYCSRSTFFKARACEGLAFCYLKLGETYLSQDYITRHVWNNYFEKEDSNVDSIFFSKACITTALILKALDLKAEAELYYDMAFNNITDLFRNNLLNDYSLLIDLYFYSGDSYRTLKLNKKTYKDWAAIYYDQIVYMCEKCEDRGEYVNPHKHALALERIIDTKKDMGIKDNQELEKKLKNLKDKMVVI